MADAVKCIVACTDASGGYSAVNDVAIAQARETGARVIFYDVSQDGRMTDPRPNFWAGEGEAELYDRPLEPVAIERLGFHELALQVQRARDEGVDAFGWLPNDPGGQGLAAYAQREHADLVLLAAGTESTAKYVDDLRQAAGTDAATATARIRLVDEDATLVPLEL
jgi:hypothetical protein